MKLQNSFRISRLFIGGGLLFFIVLFFSACENFMKGAGTKEQLDELIKAANSGEDFTIISKSPEYSSSGVYRDSAIEIQFSAPVNQSTFSYEILVDGQDVSSINYLEPYFSEDGKIVRIRANSQDLINLEGHSSKDVTVKLSDKLRSQKGSILKASLLSWTFRVNKSTDDVSPIFASLSLNNGSSENNFTEKSFFGANGSVAWEDADFYTNHANTIYFSGIAFDGGSGIDYITVKETRLRDTKNEAVNDDPIVSAPIYLEADAEGNVNLDCVYQFGLVNKEYKDGLVKLEITLTDKCGNVSEVKTYYAIKDTIFSIEDLCVSNIPSDIFPESGSIENAYSDFYKNFYWEYKTNDMWYNLNGKVFSSLPEKYRYTFEYALDFDDESTIDEYEVTETVTDAANGIKKCTAKGISFKTDKISYLRVTGYDEGGTPASIIRRIPGKPQITTFSSYVDQYSEGQPTRISDINYYIDGYNSFDQLRQFSFIANKDNSGNTTLKETSSYRFGKDDMRIMCGGSDFVLGSTLAVSFVYNQIDKNDMYYKYIAGPMEFFTFTDTGDISINKPIYKSSVYGMDAADTGTYYATIDFEPNNTNQNIKYFVALYSGSGTNSVPKVTLIPPEDVANGRTTIHFPYGNTMGNDPYAYSVRIRANLSGKEVESEGAGFIKCETYNKVPYIASNSDRYGIACSHPHFVKFSDRPKITGDDGETPYKIQYYWTPAYSGNMNLYSPDKVKAMFPSRICQVPTTYNMNIPVYGLKDGNYLLYVQVSNNPENPLDSNTPNALLTMGIMHVETLPNKIKITKIDKQNEWNYYCYYNIDGELGDYDLIRMLYRKAEDEDIYDSDRYIDITKASDSDSINATGFYKLYLYACNFVEGYQTNAVYTGEYYTDNGVRVNDVYHTVKDEAYSAPCFIYCGEPSENYTLSNFVDNNGRCSIITNMPCFVHTLCSYYDYGTDIDEWERRGQQTQYYVTPSDQTTDTSRNYIIDTSDASGINKGDYYTVIAYFADGTILQSNVYRK